MKSQRECVSSSRRIKLDPSILMDDRTWGQWCCPLQAPGDQEWDSSVFTCVMKRPVSSKRRGSEEVFAGKA